MSHPTSPRRTLATVAVAVSALALGACSASDPTAVDPNPDKPFVLAGVSDKITTKVKELQDSFQRQLSGGGSSGPSFSIAVND